jgi:hypothetical protein
MTPQICQIPDDFLQKAPGTSQDDFTPNPQPGHHTELFVLI